MPYGYHPKHFTELLKVGSALKRGQTLTAKHVAALAAAHPAIPRQLIEQRAQQVNALPQAQRLDAYLTELNGGDPQAMAQAHQLVSDFTTHYENFQREESTQAVSQEISNRIDASRRQSMTPEEKTAEKSAAPTRGYQKSELRMALENAANGDRPRMIDRNRVADKLDKSLDVLEKGGEVSRLDTVAAAFDSHAISNAVERGLLDDAPLHSES